MKNNTKLCLFTLILAMFLALGGVCAFAASNGTWSEYTESGGVRTYAHADFSPMYYGKEPVYLNYDKTNTAYVIISTPEQFVGMVIANSENGTFSDGTYTVEKGNNSAPTIKAAGGATSKTVPMNYLIICDIDLSEYGWISSNIGGYWVGETRTYLTIDSGYHSITGMNVVGTSGSNSYGLFAQASRAKLKNLVVSGKIDVNGNYVGGIVGNTANSSEITGCISNVTIKNSQSSSYTGGIVGKNLNSTVTNCVNLGNVTVSAGTAGGIAALNKDGTSSYEITNCVNAGNITNTASQYVNGIALDGTITNCLNVGTVTDIGSALIENTYTLAKLNKPEADWSEITYNGKTFPIPYATTTWEELVDESARCYNIRLNADVTAHAGEEKDIVYGSAGNQFSGYVSTFDLGGHTIDRGLGSATSANGGYGRAMVAGNGTLTVKNGTFKNGLVGSMGGGLALFGMNATLYGVTVENCRTLEMGHNNTYCGGIFSSDSTICTSSLTIRNCVIKNCSAVHSAAAWFVNSNLDIDGLEVSGCVSYSSDVIMSMNYSTKEAPKTKVANLTLTENTGKRTAII